jgi:predicted nucleic acid-binding protein
LPEVRTVYINTGPLLAFIRAGHVELLLKMPYTFVVTSHVMAEVRSGEAQGLPSADLSRLKQTVVANVDPQLLAHLDAGEASVIQAGLRHSGSWVSIDEKAGRCAARSLGLPLRGTLGILGDAKKLGLIEAVAPVIESMRETGSWFSPELVQQTLQDANEG